MARKLTTYKKIIFDYLSHYIENRNRQNVTYQLIADNKRNRYQVVRLSWEKSVFYCTMIFYFEIKKGAKIWIWVNHTEHLIDEELTELGIASEDITLGFSSPI